MAMVVIALTLSPLLGIDFLALLLTDLPRGRHHGIKRIVRLLFAAVGYALGMLTLAISFYVFSGWAAYCSVYVSRYIAVPEVTHEWLYYVTGAIWSNIPAGNAARDPSLHPFKGCLLLLSSIGAYIVFLLWPELVSNLYGWTGLVSPIVFL